MWPVLIFSDSRSRCDDLKVIVGALDRRICIECASDLAGLADLAECRAPYLALISCDNAPNALRAVAALRHEQPDLPIITEVTADRPLEALQAIAVGTTEYVKAPVAPWEWQQRSRTLIASHRQRRALKAAFRRTCRIQQRGRHGDALELTAILTRADMLHDAITGQHNRRTGRIAGVIADALGLQDDLRRQIEIGASLHDLGKIGIPDQVLHKPARYDDEDRRVMRDHPRIGYEILKNGGSAALKTGAEIALTHHERYDGSGYPSGLGGDAIPLAGRITAVADVFDALTDGRPYRHGASTADGVAHLMQQRGRLFDPDCVDALRSRLDEVAAVKGAP